MSDNAFKLQINFTKAYEGEDNVAYIEGIASGPEVDLLGERMSQPALESMVKSLQKRIVEFRDVHSEEWNAELGEVIDLSLTADNHLFYKAKLDLNISNARDLFYRLTKQGKKLGVSVGGKIRKAGYEYVADLKRSVYTYFDVDLTHIGITRQAVYHQSFAEVVLKSLSEHTFEKAQSNLAEEVFDYLLQNYPKRVLGWVKEATWEKKDAVRLDAIDMARRPGGRNDAKVKAIAEAIEDGKKMEPVVLVDDGTDKLQIADGYHRTLAFKHAGKNTIAAYVATGLEPGGPWEEEMHDAKLNKSLDDAEKEQVEQAAKAINEDESTKAEDEAAVTTDAETNAANEDTQVETTKDEDATEAAADADAASSETTDVTEDGAKQTGEVADEKAADAETAEQPSEDQEVAKALTEAKEEAETLAKSLTESNTKVEELTKSLEAKTTEAETVTKSLTETTKELGEVKKSLAEKETELEKRDARKAIVFGKFDGVELAKAEAQPQTKSPTLNRWLNS